MKKASKYLQRGVKGKEPYAFYRLAMALINGDLHEK
jgi:hypothetical protein